MKSKETIYVPLTTQNLDISETENLKVWLYGILLFFFIVPILSIILYMYNHPQPWIIQVTGEFEISNTASDRSPLLLTNPFQQKIPLTPYDLIPKGPRLGWVNNYNNKPNIFSTYIPNVVTTSMENYWIVNATGYNDYKNDVFIVKNYVNSQQSECFRCGSNGAFFPDATITNLNVTNLNTTDLTAANATIGYLDAYQGIFQNITTDNIYVIGLSTLNTVTANQITTQTAIIASAIIDMATINTLNLNLSLGNTTFDSLTVKGTLTANQANFNNVAINNTLNVSGLVTFEELVVKKFLIVHPNITQQIGPGTVNVTSIVCASLDSYGSIYGEYIMGTSIDITGSSTFGSVTSTIFNVGNTPVLQLTPNGAILLGTFTFPIDNGTINSLLGSYGNGTLFWNTNITPNSVTTNSLTVNTIATINGNAVINGDVSVSGLLEINNIQSMLFNNLVINTPAAVTIFDNIVLGGVRFRAYGYSDTDWISTISYQIGSNTGVATGTYYLGAGNYIPAVVAQTINSTGLATGWAPLYLNFGQIPGVQCVIIGTSSSSGALTGGRGQNGLYVAGDTQTTGNFYATNYYATTGYYINTVQAVSLNGGSIVLGILTFPTTQAGTSGQFLQSDGTGNVIWSSINIGNVVVSSGALTSGYIVQGDGGTNVQITNIPTSNVTTSFSALTAGNLIQGIGGVGIETTTIVANTVVVSQSSSLSSGYLIQGYNGTNVITTTILVGTATGTVVTSSAVLTSGYVLQGNGGQSLGVSYMLASTVVTSQSTFTTGYLVQGETASGEVIQSTSLAVGTSGIVVTTPTSALTLNNLVQGNGGTSTTATSIPTSQVVIAPTTLTSTAVLVGGGSTVASPTAVTISSSQGGLVAVISQPHLSVTIPETAVNGVSGQTTNVYRATIGLNGISSSDFGSGSVGDFMYDNNGCTCSFYIQLWDLGNPAIQVVFTSSLIIGGGVTATNVIDSFIFNGASSVNIPFMQVWIQFTSYTSGSVTLKALNLQQNGAA